MFSSFHLARHGRLALVAALTAGAAGLAQARDNIYWSIGVHSPGVSVGVANAAPVVSYPRYAYPSYGYPVYGAQPVVVVPRPVVVHPAPVYYVGQPQYVYKERKHHRKWRKHHRHDHDWDD